MCEGSLGSSSVVSRSHGAEMKLKEDRQKHVASVCYNRERSPRAVKQGGQPTTDDGGRSASQAMPRPAPA